MKPIRKAFPPPVVNAGRSLAFQFGRATAPLRTPPDVIMVGGQRCGTTSLFRALLSHPNILRPVMHKGVNYFDVTYDRSWNWYLAHFPFANTARRAAPPGRERARVFEASGYYMFHPHAPARIAHRLPDVSIIAMVRDPAERAYSAYKHELARGFETEPTFAGALALEDSRIEPELTRMLKDPGYQSVTYRHQAYRRRGHYAEQLGQFVDLLGKDRVHVIESELFFTEPEKEFARLTDFLGLAPTMPKKFDRYNARTGSPIDPKVRAGLFDYFEPHDQALEQLLGSTPTWRR